MKLPKLPKISFARRQKKLHASAVARRAPAADDYYEDEPKTDLSSAFVVVLILHVVAIGGVYAFNSIKVARRGPDAVSNVATTALSDSQLVTKTTLGEPPALEKLPPEPATNKTPAATLTPVSTKSSPALVAPVSKANVYRVLSGDNLTKVAALHGVTVADLEDANGIKNSTGLKTGQTLTIPAGKNSGRVITHSTTAEVQKAAFLANSRTPEAPAPPVNATAKASGKTYVVTKGDTATSIARRFGTTAEELLKLNRIEDPKKLQLGQNLKLPAKKTN